MPDATTPAVAVGPAPVELWRIDLDAAEADERPLSPDERRRAGRFVFARDRHRFVAGRVALRTILAAALDRPPQDVRFAYNACGKPRLADPGGLGFNLSHSADLCVVALWRGGEIGVDVERVGPVEAGVAAEAFSPRECLDIARLPNARRGLAFARCWTRKEAFVKALGLGFSYPAREVTVGVGATGRVLACRPEAGLPAEWHLVSFEPAAGFVGAIALRGAATLRWRTP